MTTNTIPVTAAEITRVIQEPNPFRGNVPLWNRWDIARRMGREKTAHVIRTIEIAVNAGFVHKYWGHDGTRECWIYTIQPPMF